jgi:hypothetical protein
LIALSVALFMPATSRAVIVTYLGSDPGVGPGGPRPNSTAEIDLFDAKLSTFGTPEQIINFEGLPLNAPIAAGVPLTVYDKVTMTLQGTDHTPPVGQSFGISNNSDDAMTGYNTTPGGSQFVKFVPEFGIGTAFATFAFAWPIQAFGANITGLNMTSGNLHFLFSDSLGLHDLSLTGQATGGAQFFGFTDQNERITSVTLELTGVTGNSRDVFGIDDVRFSPSIPEPSSAFLLGTGLACALLAFGLGRKRAQAGRLRASASLETN